jgi:hypothetical protein
MTLSRPAEWTRRDLAVLVLGCYALFVFCIFAFDHYPSRIEHCGDNGDYSAETAAVRAGNDSTSRGAAHFLGYSMINAPVAALLHMSNMNALAVTSTIGSLAAIALAAELWGVWVAGLFAVINLDWIQRSLLGGADPVFVAFLFATLLLARREKWVGAALMGACATVVRPLGIIALVALGVVLLWRRRYATLALAAAVSGALGGAYLLAVRHIFGNGLQSFAWYHSMGLTRDRHFIPFVTIFLQSPEHPLTWKNIAKTLAWTTFTAAAMAATALRPEMRRTIRQAPVEWLFAALYSVSFLFFPAWWIEGEYPRYYAPVIPFCIVALRPWLPERKWLVGVIGVASTLLAVVEDMPVFQQIMHKVI